MAVLYLFGALLSSFLIALILKVGEQRGYERRAVVAANYLTAALLGLLFTGSFTLDLWVIGYGLVIGFLFPLGFVLFSRGLKEEGITATVTVGRLSLAMPVVVSIVFWGERPGVIDIFSLGAILLVVLLWEDRSGRVSWILLLLFLCFGAIDSGLKYFKLRFPNADQGMFLLFLFLSALFWSWLTILLKGIEVKSRELAGGLLLGIPNFFSSYFVLLALQSVPAYITFPFINTGLIILSALAGVFLFRESLDKKKILLILLGIASVILLTT